MFTVFVLNNPLTQTLGITDYKKKKKRVPEKVCDVTYITAIRSSASPGIAAAGPSPAMPLLGYFYSLCLSVQCLTPLIFPLLGRVIYPILPN